MPATSATFNDLLERPLELLSQLGRHSLSCRTSMDIHFSSIFLRISQVQMSAHVSAFRLPRLSFNNEACVLMFCAWAPMLCALEDLGRSWNRKKHEKLTGCKVVSSPSNQISVSVRVVIPKHLAVLLAAWAAFPGAWRREGWHPPNPCHDTWEHTRSPSCQAVKPLFCPSKI